MMKWSDLFLIKWLLKTINAKKGQPNGFAPLGADGKVPSSYIPGGGGGSVTVDTALSETSENPVQNKVITAKILSDEEENENRFDALDNSQTGRVSLLETRTHNLETRTQNNETTIAGVSADLQYHKSLLVKEISAQSTDSQYPSAKCVYDAIQDIPSSKIHIQETSFKNSHYDIPIVYQGIALELEDTDIYEEQIRTCLTKFSPTVSYGKDYMTFFNLDSYTFGDTGVQLDRINETTFYLHGTLQAGESINERFYNFTDSSIPQNKAVSVSVKCMRLSGDSDTTSKFIIKYMNSGEIYIKGFTDQPSEKNAAATTATATQGKNYLDLYTYVKQEDVVFDHLFTVEIRDSETTTVPYAEFDGSYHENISTFPYRTRMSTDLNVKDYVDIQDNTLKNYVDDSLSHIHVAQTFLSPEDYGAKGDGSDDSDAIQACINDAMKKGLSIRGYKIYTISKPIVFPERDSLRHKLQQLSCYIHGLDTTAENTSGAIVIQGTSLELTVDYIRSSNCDSIIFEGQNTDKIVRNHALKLGWIYSGRNGIVFNADNAPICSVQIEFNLIQAGNYSGNYEYCGIIEYGNNYVTEINIIGGQIRYADWAVKGKISGRFYNVQVEENVQGGFNFRSGGSSILYDRHAESSRDGRNPFLKVGNYGEGSTLPTSASISGACVFNYESLMELPINEIDVSEMPIEYTTQDGVKQPIKLWYGRINCPISAALYETGSNATNDSGYLAREAIVWGRKLILKPYRKFTQSITNNFDNRANDRTLYQLPTEFIVEEFDESVTEDYITINLHASYCFLGYNKFKIVQKNDKKAKVYDYDGNLIFDGTEYDNGEFIITHYQTTKRMPSYDGTGLAWKAEMSARSELYEMIGEVEQMLSEV